ILAACYNALKGGDDNPLGDPDDEPGAVQLWDAKTYRPITRLTGMKGKVLHVALSPDGKRAATGGGKQDKFGEVKLYDTTSGKLLAEMVGPTYRVETVTFSPDGKYLA